MLGLRRWSAFTLVPNWVAIENSVSPGLTVHLTCWPPPLVVVSLVVVSVVVVSAGVVEGDVEGCVLVVVVVFVVVAGGGGGGSGGGSGGAGSGGGGVSGTESVSTGPPGPVEGGGVPSDGCPIQPTLERISTITVTAPSSAAGAR
jgi:hypothetical protein